jgi:hypothetical protein
MKERIGRDVRSARNNARENCKSKCTMGEYKE